MRRLASRLHSTQILSALLLLTNCALHGQEPTDANPLTVGEAVSIALQRYPAIRVSEAQVRSAAAAIQLARTAYLPNIDVTGGVNRATRNNIFGLLLPSQIIAPVSGPVLDTNSLASAWGSTVGVLVSWEPFDFGLRRASVEAAAATRARAEEGVNRTKLDIATLVADAALTVIAAEQTVVAANAAVERASELQRITDALVTSELRPGAESSLARAEHASARAQVIRARQAVAEAKATLGALLGMAPAAVAVAGQRLLMPSEVKTGSADVTANPLAREQDAAVNEARARIRALNRTYFPRFSIQGTSYARGSGALPTGRLLGGIHGLGPNIQNWAVGFTATFPLFDLPAIQARRAAENAALEAEQGRYQQVLQELKARRDRALAAYESSVQIAATTPVMAEAANAALQQARARYQAGLGTALDLADAQRRLAQAEIDDSLARLGIWRARLAMLAAEGDITPLLTEVSQ